MSSSQNIGDDPQIGTISQDDEKYEEESTDSECIDCSEFYPGLLKKIDIQLRKKIIKCLHSVIKGIAHDPEDICEEVQTGVDAIKNLDNVVYFIIMRELATALLKTEKYDAAITLVKKRLTGNSKDYWIYLVLGRLEEETGNYSEALEYHTKAEEKAGEEVLRLALAKMKKTIDNFHMNQSMDLVRRNQYEVEDMLRGLEGERILLRSPISENATLFLDAYKTLAYFCKLENDFPKSIDYHKKALSIIVLEPAAHIQLLKIHTQLSLGYAKDNNNRFAEIFLLKSLDFVGTIIENEQYMLVHVDTVIHVMSRIVHTYQQIEQYEASLKIRLHLIDIVKKYLPEDHPEAARVSSDIALLYYLMKDSKNMDEYIEITESALNDCGYVNDITKKKLYIRELSDSLRNLGNIFTKISDFANAEIQYLASLKLNEEVYGETHQRTAQIHRGLGHLFLRSGDLFKAQNSFRTCLGILKLHLPKTRVFVTRVESDLKKACNPKRAKWYGRKRV